ncbi:mechanosensitive ion channel family protein [Arthrobacter sp. D3-16]
MQDLLNPAMPLIAVTLAVAAGLVLSWLLRKLVLRLNRRRPELQATSRVARQPLRLALCLIGVRTALGLTAAAESWLPAVDHLLLIALVGSLAWLAVAVLLIIEAVVLGRYSVDVADNRRARRLRTQMILARRIGVALVVVLAVGSVMLTFPAIQALGAGLLASAGVISIVAGLAAQTSLVNVFAGMQLAFTDAIRVDDVVVVQKEWGRIEEITLTYVVVHIWDDRRLILPSTYFTTTPFENWTRRQSEVMGTVEFDLDWRAPWKTCAPNCAPSLPARSCGTSAWASCRSPTPPADLCGSASWSALRTAPHCSTCAASSARPWSASCSRAIPRPFPSSAGLRQRPTAAPPTAVSSQCACWAPLPGTARGLWLSHRNRNFSPGRSKLYNALGPLLVPARMCSRTGTRRWPQGTKKPLDT